MDSGISSDINKFAVDTKIGRIIMSDYDAIALQAELDRKNEWTDWWQMQLNIKKWKVFSVGINNPWNICGINNDALINSEYETK